jgi:uncharacterized membrane protein
MGQNNKDKSSENTRLVYLDNLRSLVIILAILYAGMVCGGAFFSFRFFGFTIPG